MTDGGNLEHSGNVQDYRHEYYRISSLQNRKSKKSGGGGDYVRKPEDLHQSFKFGGLEAEERNTICRTDERQQTKASAGKRWLSWENKHSNIDKWF